MFNSCPNRFDNFIIGYFTVNETVPMRFLLSHFERVVYVARQSPGLLDLV
jgi:hypothetical protein